MPWTFRDNYDEAISIDFFCDGNQFVPVMPLVVFIRNQIQPTLLPRVHVLQKHVEWPPTSTHVVFTLILVYFRLNINHLF